MAELLRARCARCHAAPAPAGGWRADTYVGAVGCTASGKPAATREPSTPILAALDRADHAGFVSAAERATLTQWLAAGAPSRRSGVHTPAFTDPRSPESHGQFLRAQQYRPMLDVTHADACGRCHDGAPSRPPSVTSPAAEATACTTCHSEPAGPLACTTCHGAPGRAFPPRDPCFFPADAPSPAHAAHAGSSPSHAAGFSCTTCHPTPTLGSPEGPHANGHVEVWLDHGVAGREATFDPRTKQCAGTCHARGGARPTPSWSPSEAKMTCGDCHTSPPPSHASHRTAVCTSCHHEANTSGTALSPSVLHVNGKVDLGDGSGKCGACHGQGDSPWPTTGAHAAHAQPKGARPVACETCHVVPETGERHPLAGSTKVRLSGLAIKGGRRATWDPASKTCAGTYCHEGSGASVPAPSWVAGPTASACGACHSVPPGAPHTQSATCSVSGCHLGSTTSQGAITPAGRAAHVNGFLERVVP